MNRWKNKIKAGYVIQKILPLYQRICWVKGQLHGRIVSGVQDYSAFNSVKMREAEIGFL